MIPKLLFIRLIINGLFLAVSVMLTLLLVSKINFKHKKTAFILVFLVIFIIFQQVLYHIAFPKLNMLYASYVISKGPIYKIAMEVDPSLSLNDIITDEARSALRRRNGAGEAISVATQNMMAVILRDLPRFSDEAVEHYFRVTHERMKQLRTVSPDTCAKIIFPEIYGIPDTNYIQDREEDIQAIRLLVESANVNNQQRFDREEGERAMANILQQSYPGLDDDLSKGDSGKICSIVISMNDKVLALPQHQRGNTIKAVLLKGIETTK